MWIGHSFDEIDVPALRKKSGAPFTHDNLFHTALGFLEVDTAIYRPEMDILQGARRPEVK
jgi:lipid A ethanolaminephosphotransferase